MPEQQPEVRRKNFDEVPYGLVPGNGPVGGRTAACSARNRPVWKDVRWKIDIPGFIKLIQEGDFQGSIRKLWEKPACRRFAAGYVPRRSSAKAFVSSAKKINRLPSVTWSGLPRDYERQHGTGELPPKEKPIGKKVAVVGSGPSGLTVAGDLILKGHDVTIFEAFHMPGGVLVYGIPEFRLPKDIVFSEVNFLERLGVKLECNQVVGRTVSMDELFEEGFEAVFLGVGAGLPTFLKVPGENLIGIYSANEYLTRTNLMKAYLFPKYDTPIIRGKNVIALGAGNVAMDSARTALRLGAESSKIVYRRSRDGDACQGLPKSTMPKKKGSNFISLTAPVKFLGNDKGRVIGMEGLKMELGEPDDSGRRRPIPIKGSEFQLETDLVIIAVGAGANPS